jgi:hypothetical protein
MAHSQLEILSAAATRWRWAAVLAFCILLPALLSGCAKAKAADLVPDGPPLAVPEPPPREIAPVEVVVEAPPPPPPAPAAPEPVATAPSKPTRQPARPEPKTETPAPVAAQPPTTPPAAEGREIRAGPSAAAAAEEKKVRDLMGQATRDLNRVDYRKLSAEGKSQYDQSKRFAEQADQAIKEKNFVYAMTLADKAATLAAELLGR